MTAAPTASTFADPLPGTWVMFQKWRHLLFASWPLAPDEMRRHVPPNFELDTFDGKAWLSLVPMHMEDLHFRFFPPIPGTSDFPEINVRTYVRVPGRNGKPDGRGVYFFSIDASCWLGSLVARWVFHTPYQYAHMQLTERGDYHHMVMHRSASSHSRGAAFVASYRALGEPSAPPDGSHAAFLVNRDTAFAVSRGTLYWGPIQHAPWKLAAAEAEFEVNTLASAAGIKLPDEKPE
ncbi:MAG: YqjF family protein, partial [Gemmatimonadaceae bacterium]